MALRYILVLVLVYCRGPKGRELEAIDKYLKKRSLAEFHTPEIDDVFLIVLL